MTLENKIQKLINGETISITDIEERKIIQKRLRAIKSNCIEVLKQLSDKTLG